MTGTGIPVGGLSPGDAASLTRTVTQEDIDGFATATGDLNPVHRDGEEARASAFGGPVAHGMLTAALVSAVIGTRLPGPGTVYVSQELRFRRPVRPGETVTATVTVHEVRPERNRVVLDTVVDGPGGTVLTGRAVVIPPTPGRP